MYEFVLVDLGLLIKRKNIVLRKVYFEVFLEEASVVRGVVTLALMAENGNLNNNKFENFNNTQTTREFKNRSTTAITTDINSTTTSLLGTTTNTNIIETPGLSERDATHFRLRDGVIEGFEYLTCLSCGESFKSTSLIEVYDHYRERPHLRHYANCLYCQGKVYQYYHNRQRQVKYYHNCLRWKIGEDQ